MSDEPASVFAQDWFGITKEELDAREAGGYQRGLAAGRAEALEQAAGVCDERAEYWRVASGTGADPARRDRYGNWEDAAVTVAAAIRALAQQPPPTGGHGAETVDR